MSSQQLKPFAQMSRRELIAEIKSLRREPENEVTLQMLVSAGFVTAAKVAQARKIARGLAERRSQGKVPPNHEYDENGRCKHCPATRTELQP